MYKKLRVASFLMRPARYLIIILLAMLVFGCVSDDAGPSAENKTADKTQDSKTQDHKNGTVNGQTATANKTQDTKPGTLNCSIFPPDNPWNTDISGYPVHNNSDNFVASIGADENLHPDFGTLWAGGPNGIPYDIVTWDQEMIPIVFTEYGDESDPGPYPVPLNATIEHGDDRHVIVVDMKSCMLYELYMAYPKSDHWEAESGAKYNLSSNELRQFTWTSADAAGLPIFPGLVRYDEVESGEINHALRFTIEETQMAVVHPARHYASDITDPDVPPMGLRFRLKADYDISGFSEKNQVILAALKKYGMIVADNGGDWFVSGAPDTRWDDEDLVELWKVKGSDFEVVYTGDIITYE